MIVAVDTDQNPDTGSAFYGTEFELAPDAIGDAMLFRAQGWDFRAVRNPEGLAWGCGPHTALYGISANALGLAPEHGFNVVVAVLGPHTDTARDTGTFNYQPVAGLKPPPLGPDRRPPHLVAYRAEARRLRRARCGEVRFCIRERPDAVERELRQHGIAQRTERE